MKKTYINPNMEVVKMQIHQQLLDASNRGITNENANKTGDYYDDARLFDFDEE